MGVFLQPQWVLASLENARGLPIAWGISLSQPPPFLPSHPLLYEAELLLQHKQQRQQELMICCAHVSPDSGKLPGPGAAVHWKTLQKVLASILCRGRGRRDGRERRRRRTMRTKRGGSGEEGFERLRENHEYEAWLRVPLVLQLKVVQCPSRDVLLGSGF